ncbi:hypothetical protein HAX54_012055 [Datura stramonium]|uniref:Uncharacterized protein n=1 Tax=Datura stramonium TaxID=4076 RepID=A0ABS8TL36_DATST|nr:hypothetical protein [Datura stramonium]
MTAELSPNKQMNLLEFFKAVARRDGCAAAECTLNLSKKQNCPNPDAFIKPKNPIGNCPPYLFQASCYSLGLPTFHKAINLLCCWSRSQKLSNSQSFRFLLKVICQPEFTVVPQDEHKLELDEENHDLLIIVVNARLSLGLPAGVHVLTPTSVPFLVSIL